MKHQLAYPDHDLGEFPLADGPSLSSWGLLCSLLFSSFLSPSSEFSGRWYLSTDTSLYVPGESVPGKAFQANFLKTQHTIYLLPYQRHDLAWQSLRFMMKSERSQKQRVTCSMIPCIWNTQIRQTHGDKKQINGFLGLEGSERRQERVCEVSFWADKNVLELERDSGCKTSWAF